MAYTLYTRSFGTNYANNNVSITNSTTAAPATILSSATGGLVNNNGLATLDSSGNLSVYIDTAVTWTFTVIDEDHNQSNTVINNKTVGSLAELNTLTGTPGVVYTLGVAPYTSYMWDGGAMRPISGLSNTQVSGIQALVSGAGTIEIYAQPDATGVWPARPNGLTINIPTWARFLTLGICTSGGGGGSGRRGAAGTARSGGAGGQSGIAAKFHIPLRDASGNFLATTGALTVGNSTGGAAVTTDDTNGNAGSIVATSSFIFAGTTYSTPGAGGAAAPGGTNASVNATAGVYGHFVIFSPIATNVATSLGTAFPGGIISAGVAGGSISVADALLTTAGSTLTQGGAGNLSVTAPGADGIGVRVGEIFSAVGAAGGASSISAPAQNGGNGIYGSGGGGGGASLNGFASGAGGRGGAGWAILIWE